MDTARADCRTRTWTLTVVAAVLLAAGTAEGQGLELRGLATRPSGADLVPTVGAEVVLRPGRVPLVLALGTQSGRATRPFSFCAGLVPPGADCSPQPTQVHTRLRTASVGYEALLLSGRWRAALTPHLAAIWLRSEWNSRVSVERWDDQLVVPSLGLEATVSRRLPGSLPLRLAAGTRLLLSAGRPGECMDCFVPSYDAGFTTGSLFAGLEYALR